MMIVLSDICSSLDIVPWKVADPKNQGPHGVGRINQIRRTVYEALGTIRLCASSARRDEAGHRSWKNARVNAQRNFVFGADLGLHPLGKGAVGQCGA